jgi:hypothetical protein
MGVLVLIRIAMYVPMFWIRRRFRLTGNARLGIAVSGAYLLIFALAAFYYGAELKLVDIHKTDYCGILGRCSIGDPATGGVQSKMEGS